MKHHLIFVNGDPRSGKDTVSEMLVQAFKGQAFVAQAFSSIEPVRFMLTDAGFDLSAKTEADRRLLSEVGDSAERHSGFRSKACVDEFWRLRLVADNARVALVLHTREPATIHKIAWQLRNENVRMTTLFVSGRGERITSNPSDAGVRDMTYDREIVNDGSLDDLRVACAELTGDLVASR